MIEEFKQELKCLHYVDYSYYVNEDDTYSTTKSYYYNEIRCRLYFNDVSKSILDEKINDIQKNYENLNEIYDDKDLNDYILNLHLIEADILFYYDSNVMELKKDIRYDVINTLFIENDMKVSEIKNLFIESFKDITINEILINNFKI